MGSVCACMLSCFSRVRLFATLWIVAHQAPLSMGFFRQEYWSGLPFPPPGDITNPGVKPASLTSPVLVGRFFTTSATWDALIWAQRSLQFRKGLRDGWKDQALQRKGLNTVLGYI